MKSRLLYFIAFICSTCFSACENEGVYYDNVSRLYITGDAAQGAVSSSPIDSIVFSFKKVESTYDTYDIHVVGHIVGKVSNKDRHFELQVIDSLTTAPADSYTIKDMVVPAGSYSGTASVSIAKTVSGIDLSSEYACVVVQLLPTDDFAIGNIDKSIFKIQWCNYLTKPSTWSVIQAYIGPYTQARYKFVIDNSGFSEYSAFSGNWNKIISLQSQMKQALIDYNNDASNAGREEGWPYMNDDGVTPLQIGSGLPY